MEEENAHDVEIAEDIGKFTESYSSFNNIINKIQRQYLALKETYTRQSEELQSVNKTLQSLMSENRAVTEFLNSILNSLSSGVIAVETSGRISHLNPVARKILGIEDDRVQAGNLLYEETVKAVENPEYSAMQTIRTGREIEDCEKRIKSCHGTIMTVSVSTSLLKNRGGEIIGAVELFHDISKLKRMEKQLSQMKVLASLGEMAASIAHEVRNPLAGVGGFASLLTRDLSDDPPKREMAEKIVEGVESINNTIQTLLDFARREKVQKTTIELNSYLNMLLDNCPEETGTPDGGDRVVRGLNADKQIFVELDVQLFKQVIFNFIKNGLEAGEGKTKVWIRTEELPLVQAQAEYGDRLELSGTETLAKIVIEDDGPGIPREVMDKLFTPFHSTKENGIGLGLSIAWKIIKAHGGDVAAVSTAGRGTKFSIVLPIQSGSRQEK